MNENECAVAVTAWLLEVVPELNAGAHYLSAQKGELPDVMVDVDEKKIVGEHPAFPYAVLQQVDLRVFTLSCAFMVEKGTSTPENEADRDETELLRGIGATVEEELVADATLGNRVPFASPFATYEYRLPFVQYPDGTRGRQMTVTMFVAEPTESSR